MPAFPPTALPAWRMTLTMSVLTARTNGFPSSPSMKDESTCTGWWRYCLRESSEPRTVAYAEGQLQERWRCMTGTICRRPTSLVQGDVQLRGEQVRVERAAREVPVAGLDGGH